MSKIEDDPQTSRLAFDLCRCANCGLLQQCGSPPLELLKPRFEWQRFREPEDHLDGFADEIMGQLAKIHSPKIYGISWQDSSLLRRLHDRGARTQELDPHELGVTRGLESFGIESIQDALTEARADEVVRRHGMADAVIVRDVLEHAFDPLSFLKALRGLVKENGLVVIEVPSSEQMIKNFRYWLLWEHHISYFSPQTLEFGIRASGLSPVSQSVLHLDAGEYLTVIAKKSPAARGLVAGSLKNQKGDFVDGSDEFSLRYPAIYQEIGKKLQHLRDQSRPIFFYGANHVTRWWIQVFKAEGLLDGVIDDAPEKQGFCLAGSALRVSGSATLEASKSAICLHLFGPLLAQKILNKLPAFTRQGGMLLNAESFYGTNLIEFS